jgi:hypothetical protein
MNCGEPSFCNGVPVLADEYHINTGFVTPGALAVNAVDVL